MRVCFALFSNKSLKPCMLNRLQRGCFLFFGSVCFSSLNTCKALGTSFPQKPPLIPQIEMRVRSKGLSRRSLHRMMNKWLDCRRGFSWTNLLLQWNSPQQTLSLELPPLLRAGQMLQSYIAKRAAPDMQLLSKEMGVEYSEVKKRLFAAAECLLQKQQECQKSSGTLRPQDAYCRRPRGNCCSGACFV